MSSRFSLPASSAPGGSQPPPPSDNKNGPGPGDIKRNAKRLVSENPVIVFGQKGCSMCLVVKVLLQRLGVNPLIVEVEVEDEAAVIDKLSSIDVHPADANSLVTDVGQVQFPAVFLGGKLFGGVERLMASHVAGELVPLLIRVGARWL